MGQLTRTLMTMDRLAKDDACDLEMLRKYITKAEQQFGKIEEKHSELIDAIEEQAEFEIEEEWMAECETEFVQVLLCTRRVIDCQSQSPLANQPFLLSLPTTPQPSPSSTVPNVQPVSTGTLPWVSSPAPLVPSPMMSTVPIQPVRTGTLPSVSSPATLTQSPVCRPSTSSTPKMARMKFPMFSGDLKDYKRFKELFTHCSAGLTEIECFYQLTESMSNARERNDKRVHQYRASLAGAGRVLWRSGQSCRQLTEGP